MENFTKFSMKELEMIKNIAHTIMHRMTWWQYIWKGWWWRKRYDKACAEVAKRNQSYGE